MEEFAKKPIKIVKKLSLSEVPWGIAAKRLSAIGKFSPDEVQENVDRWCGHFSKHFLLRRYLQNRLSRFENHLFSFVSETIGADSFVIFREREVYLGVAKCTLYEEVLISPEFNHDGRGTIEASGAVRFKQLSFRIKKLPALLILHLLALLIGVALSAIAGGLVAYGIAVLYLSFFQIEHVRASAGMQIRVVLAFGALALGTYTLFGRGLIVAAYRYLSKGTSWVRK